jgi:hypothetical protein
MVWRVLLAVGFLTFLLVPAGSAFAQEEGVTIDPDSPPGKEYALPLDSARGQAAPSSDPPSVEATGEPAEADAAALAPAPAPAFGVGVEAPAERSTGQRERGEPQRDRGEPRRDERSGGRAPTDGTHLEIARVPAAERSASVSNGAVGPLLWSGVSAAALVAVGLGIGAIRRRTDRQTR